MEDPKLFAKQRRERSSHLLSTCQEQIALSLQMQVFLPHSPGGWVGCETLHLHCGVQLGSACPPSYLYRCPRANFLGLLMLLRFQLNKSAAVLSRCRCCKISLAFNAVGCLRVFLCLAWGPNKSYKQHWRPNQKENVERQPCNLS